MTIDQLPKLKKQTLVNDFITRFEEMILSGKLSIGERLPSERDLAAQLGVSRPVVHEGLIDLATKGLISRNSSGGAVINDFRKNGSLPILTSLLSFHDSVLDQTLAKDTLEFRLLIEVENARLAARNRTEIQLSELKAVLVEEKSVDAADLETISQLDFKFHHLIAMSTGNIFYPLLLNSSKSMYMNFVRQFYKIPDMAKEVITFHKDLVKAIEAKNEKTAAAVMTRMLEHGSRHFAEVIRSNK